MDTAMTKTGLIPSSKEPPPLRQTLLLGYIIDAQQIFIGGKGISESIFYTHNNFHLIFGIDNGYQYTVWTDA